MKTKPEHAPMTQFQSQGDDLLINRIPLRRLALRVGQTPFYAYDRSVIADKVEQLRTMLEGSAHIHFAIKANPMPALVNYIAPLVDGLDVASGKELRVALDSGLEANKISFAGPGKNTTELLMAVASGVTINIESELELQRIIDLSQSHGLIANVAVRVNPDFQLKTSGMKMAGGPQQFGIDAEAVPAVLKTIKQSAQLKFLGLHIFTGSQNLNADAIIEAHNNIFQLASELKHIADIDMPSLNIGGGFGIPYFPGETTLDLAPVVENLKQLNQQFSDDFSATEIILELGRYLVGDAGVFVSKVTDVKTSRNERFAIVDGGLHHHLAASGNFGQVIRKNYPVAIGNKMSHSREQEVSVVGPLCTPLDILAKKMMLPTVEIDDLIVIFQSGAYGFTASPKEFLSHQPPVEVLV